MARARATAASKRVHQRVAIPLEKDGSLRLAVVADTHSEPHPRAIALVAAEKPACILHAGDIGDLGVLTELERVAPLMAVRGNIDERANDLPDALTLDIQAGDRTVLRLLLFHIAVYGPKLRADAALLAREEKASLVVCGHSHIPFIGRDRGLAIFNPGSIGPRRFHLPIVYGVIDIKPDRIAMHHVDCETGQRWEP